MTEPGLNRRFLTVWAGQSLSAIGSVVSGVGVAVFVFVETGNAAWLGALAALATVPYVLTAPLMTLTDRYSRRSVMIAGDAFAVLGPAVALALAIAGHLEVWHLAIAGFLGGIGTSFQWPASQAAMPALVAPEALDRANGLNQLGPAVGIVIGPVLATLLVATWGIEAVLIVDIVTFVIAVSATLAVRFDDATDDSDVADDGSWHALWSWLRTDGRPLIVLLAVMAAVNFLLAFFNVSLLVLATDIGGTARAGLAMGAGGAAMVVGSLVSARRGVGPDRVATFARALVLAGAGFVFAALFSSLATVIVGVVVALGSFPLVNAAVSTLYHERVPASMHGRMFGLRTTIGRALEPLGAVIAGLVVARVAEPALAADGPWAGSVGRVIGTGEGRGAALVMATIGVVVGLGGVWLARSALRRELMAPGEDAETSDDTIAPRVSSA